MIFQIGQMQRDINGAFFKQLSRLEQTQLLQELYDIGYSVPEIAKKFNIKPQAIYGKIDAYRGRGSTISA